ncbi:MAG: S8 family serine peptidase [Rhodobacterales bacterium]|nr:S8 family serine peptidase [Rhodobacterales bacterium]
MTPTDPLYSSQWQYSLIGDIETIWDEYDGSGIHVGIYDDGIDYNHEDLDDNYDGALGAVDDEGNPIDPYPGAFVPDGDGHGTSVAGIIAAENNGTGGIGIAWGASVSSVKIFDPNAYGDVNGPTAEFMDVALQATQFDISQNSWGATPLYNSGLADGGFADLLDQVYANTSAVGRDGSGTVITQAAGNEDRDANGDGVNVSRFTITVAATDENGNAAWYSNYGACILVTAPAAAVTTDLSGDAGYDPTDYTTDFGGTSAATPVVSGVIALMLDANDALGWRDVQNILAASATLTGSDYDALTLGAEEEGLWQSNNASTWNGGGYHIHTNYGYGMVNVYAAVRMAEVWTLFDTAATSANEVVLSTAEVNLLDVAVPDGDPTGLTTTFVVTSDIEIDHVALNLDMTTTRVGDLKVTLTSAEGTEIVVALGSNTRTNVDGTWVYGIDGLRGETTAGTWTINVTDVRTGTVTTLDSASLDFYGSASSANDVYHFTDEYLVMLGYESARATVTDTDGGVDWINMAAVTGDVQVGINSGGTFSSNGFAWGTFGSAFENIVTGDGDDTITGNQFSNYLLGMRGNDTISAVAGNDTVEGGDGNDVLYGGTGLDTLTGGDGTDTLIGGNGNDVYFWDLSDMIVENAGSGTGIDLVKSSTKVTLVSNVENLTIVGSSGTSGIGNELANVIRGNNYNNKLVGNGGNDSIFGDSGNDTLFGNGGKDFLSGGDGADIFVFNSTLSSANMDGVDDFVTAADTIHLDDAIYTALAIGALSSGAFARNTTGNAVDSSDRIIYEKDTGFLFYDADGSKTNSSAVQFATLDKNLNMTSADFIIV